LFAYLNKVKVKLLRKGKKAHEDALSILII